MSLTVGSLFSGIGGLDLGLERAGMRVIWQSEIDPYACRVLAKHWPTVPNLGDITTIDWSSVERPDVICGGYPCQPFSLAGVRRGESDPRHLWPHFAEAIRVLRPRYALLENVPGHLSLGFGRVLGDLADLGFDAEWDCIPAAAVGAPHLRYRIFLVAANEVVCADADCGRLEVSAQLGSPAQQDPTDWRPCRRHADRLRDEVADPNCARPQGGRQVGSAHNSNHWTTEPDVGGTLDGFSAWLDRPEQSHQLDLAYGDASEAGPREELRTLRRHLEAEAACERPPGGSERISPSSVLLAYVRQLEARATDEARLLVAGTEAPRLELRSLRGDDEPDSAPRGSEHCEQRPQEHSDALQALSRLLARHAEASWAAYRWSHASPVLSGWHAGWDDGIPRVASGVPARVDRLRALGNAVVPQVAEWVGRRIVESAA